MLPIALGWGASDGSFRSPMAVAVIGGLITSTFLSLLVIPAVFTYMDDVEGLIRRVVGGTRRVLSRGKRGAVAKPQPLPTSAE
jgi:AcrB/AcrD/AcrF family